MTNQITQMNDQRKKVKVNKEECNHVLGILGTMETISVTRDYFIRKCRVCKNIEKLRRAGKTYVGYSVEAESLRDFDRREHAKDLLQAWEPGGKVNPLFEEAYGDPKKRGKSKKGKGIDKAQIKKAREKMVDRAGRP